MKERLFGQPRHGRHSRLPAVIACLCALLLLLSLAMLWKDRIQGAREQGSFDALKAGLQELPLRPAQPRYTVYYAVYEQNSDFAAWLTVPGTKVDYPVMHTPQEPEYYLRRAFDGSESRSGTPFIGEGCTLDDNFCIIYGHNMSNKTMFGTLERYINSDFQAENPVFTLTTITEQREYEVFAAVRLRLLYQEESGYRPLAKSGELTEAEYAELTAWLKDNALYDTGITPAYGEQLLLLATCSYHTDNGRLIVAARRIADGS